MRSLGQSLALPLFLLCISSDLLEACGDKFIVPGSTGFTQYSAPAGPLFVLLYRDETSETARRVLDGRVEKTLKRVGYRVDVATDHAGLEELMMSTAYDVVLVDSVEATYLRTIAESALNPPAILPFAYEASLSDMATLQVEFGAALNAPTRATELIATIQESVALVDLAQRP